MSDVSPTQAQLAALEYVCEHGPCFRPRAYRGAGPVVRRNVWDHCHRLGWLDGVDPLRPWLRSELTPAGCEVLQRGMETEARRRRKRRKRRRAGR
jgi:hypothetical protein